jgi:hypothetical protein
MDVLNDTETIISVGARYDQESRQGSNCTVGAAEIIQSTLLHLEGRRDGHGRRWGEQT